MTIFSWMMTRMILLSIRTQVMNLGPHYNIPSHWPLQKGRVMFTHSKNVNINGGEFYAITYGATTSETAQKGKHHHSVFMSQDLKRTLHRYRASPRRSRLAHRTIQMSDTIPQNAIRTHGRPFYRRSRTGSKTWIVRLGFCGCMDRQELESQR